MIGVTAREMQIILDVIRQNAADCNVLAFGSRYKGSTNESSDLDLVFDGGEKLGFMRLQAIKEAFWESDLPYRVDVLDYHAISPEFRAIIDEGHERIQERIYDAKLKIQNAK